VRLEDDLVWERNVLEKNLEEQMERLKQKTDEHEKEKKLMSTMIEELLCKQKKEKENEREDLHGNEGGILAIARQKDEKIIHFRQ